MLQTDAKTDSALPDASATPGLMLGILHKLTKSQLDLRQYAEPLATVRQEVAARLNLNADDDWQAVQAICGYGAQDFTAAGAPLPLTAATIHHFCRNHRDCDVSLGGQFETVGSALPESLAVLYSVYTSQARVDAEATLFLAQASGSTRVAATMADLLAIGGFCHGTKSISCQGHVYAVASAFDTAQIIDAANIEARTRLAFPAEHEGHLLRLTPDQIGILAAELAAAHRLDLYDFVKKANLMAEARQDVNRFTPAQHFTTALFEGDLPISEAWVGRIIEAMRRIIPAWAGDLPQGYQGDKQLILA